MDAVYSYSLLLSFLSSAVAIVALVVRRVRSQKTQRELSGIDRIVRKHRFWGATIVLSAAALAVSIWAHLLSVHRPGTNQALGLVGFVKLHPSFLIAAAMVLSAILLIRHRSPEEAK